MGLTHVVSTRRERFGTGLKSKFSFRFEGDKGR